MGGEECRCFVLSRPRMEHLEARDGYPSLPPIPGTRWRNCVGLLPRMERLYQKTVVRCRGVCIFWSEHEFQRYIVVHYFSKRLAYVHVSQRFAMLLGLMNWSAQLKFASL